MARAELRLKLSRPDGVYAPGEIIEGELRARVLENIPSVKLGLSRDWTLRWTRGNESGSSTPTALVDAAWKAGEEHVIPFQVPTPVAPPSHRGPVVTVDWRLALTGWTDEAPAVPLILQATPSRAVETKDAAGETAGSAAGRGAMLGCGLIFMAGIGVLGATGARKIDPGWLSTLIGALSGALLGLPVGLVIAKSMATEAALDAKLGPLRVTLTPSSVRPGETVALAVEFTPAQEVRLELAEAALKGTEESRETKHGAFTGPSGTIVGTAALHERKKALAKAVSLRAGERARLEVKFEIPADAPGTFSHALGKDLTFSTSWSVDVQLWIQGVEEARTASAVLTIL